jgi:hypothetical protein
MESKDDPVPSQMMTQCQVNTKVVTSQNFERISNLCTHKIITSFHAHASILSSDAHVYQRFLTFFESKSFPVIKQRGDFFLQSSKLI